VIVETARLALRTLGMDDAPELQALFGDPEVMRFYDGLRDLTATRAWIARHTAFYRTRGCGVWGVEAKGAPGLLGYCGLVPQEVEGEEEIEIGYLLARRSWGRGYATEAAAACRDLAFGRFGAPRVVSLIDPGNARSIAVARRVGMTFRREIEKWGRAIAVYTLDRPDAAPPDGPPG